jgi:uncharacterized protein YndB with AHSA1/START domain
MEKLGTITGEGETRTLRFERRLEHPAATVWAALTEPERLAEWLAEAVVEGRKDGSMTLDFGEGGKEGGRITVWDPPRVLAYEWQFTGETPSQVRWELSELDGGRITVLTLEHALLPADGAAGYGAGWHGHLDQLEGHLAGSVPDWSARFEELRPTYETLAAAEKRPVREADQWKGSGGPRSGLSAKRTSGRGLGEPGGSPSSYSY